MPRKARSKSFVIAVAGASGAGKTSLVRKIAALLDDSVTFYFDDYGSTHRFPKNVKRWANVGFDPHRWQNQRMLKDLRLLSQGAPVIPPDSGREVKPARFIVMEEPFGRRRRGMDALVDFVVCIDIPLEIALARRILRELGEAISRKETVAYAERLRDHLCWYLHESGREMYFGVNENAKENCDLVVDGTKGVDELASEVVRHVKKEVRTRRPYGDHTAR